LDSVLILANRALSYDSQLSEAYFVKGNYYARTGDKDNAAKEFNKALNLNPNDWLANYGKAMLYDHEDYVTFLDNLYKALRINQNGKETPTIYRIMGGGYLESGFIDSAKACFKRAFELDKDSSFYLSCLSGTERDQGNYKKSAEYCKRALKIRPDYWEVKFRLANNLYDDGQFGEAVKYFEDLKIRNPQSAFAWWQTGSKKKADLLFNRLAFYNDSLLKSNSLNGQVIYSYFDLACINSFKGDIRNALKYIMLYSQIK
jgi:tetratricopeptide (TPR) repeat protein